MCNEIVVLTAVKTRVSKSNTPKTHPQKQIMQCVFGHQSDQTTIKYSEMSVAKMIVQNYFLGTPTKMITH